MIRDVRKQSMSVPATAKREAAVAALALSCLVTLQAVGDGTRAITVADTIQMTKLGDREYFRGGSAAGRVARCSPDGKKFVVILRRGNIQENTNEYSLLLWQSANVLKSPTPELLLTMSSSSNRAAISDVAWLPDNVTLTFLGENATQLRQLYSFNIQTRALQELTTHATNVMYYSLSARNHRIAYVAEVPDESLWDERARRDGVLVSRQWIQDLLTGRKGYSFRGRSGEMELFIQGPGGPRQLNTRGKLRPWRRPCLSPDGRYIVVAADVPSEDVPRSWARYKTLAAEIASRADGMRIPPVTSSFQRYELVDSVTGTSRVLLNSPIDSGAEPIWRPDSRSVVLRGVLLPLEGVSTTEQRAREAHVFTAEVRIADGRITTIDDERLRTVGSDAERERAGAEARLEVFLREDMNTPPKIYVRDRGTRRESLLLDLNPQFEALRFGRVEEIEWEVSHGRTVKAGLYYPPDFTLGRRYPLVIQTHHWDPGRFWIDGPWTTSYAAQPLAAQGMVVLQVADEPLDYGILGTKGEVENALAIYDSVIERLARQGLIDPSHVGIIGFSHTCFFVKYALIHSKYRLAAASIAEGEDGGYLQFVTGHNWFVDVTSLYGGPPFGEALGSWMKDSPEFNVDKNRTPLRITVLNPHFLLLDWEWFYASKILGKPVEMVMMQDGDHILEKPSDRMISQQGTVDWFRFWLQGYEDPSQEKVEQYRRWETLCDMQVVQNPNQPAFCVRTKTH